MKKTFTSYQQRPVKFIELVGINEWTIKAYSISYRNTFDVSAMLINLKKHLPAWLENSKLYQLPNYNLGTLIIHEGKDKYYIIINWWLDQNMLQQFVYTADHSSPDNFALFSDRGMNMCIWEMEVLWHERNAWVRHVLENPERPDFDAYLRDHLLVEVNE